MGHPRPLFRLFKQTLQCLNNKYLLKMSIQCMVRGFKPTTFRTRVSSHNHQSRAPAIYKQCIRQIVRNVLLDVYVVSTCVPNLYLSLKIQQDLGTVELPVTVNRWYFTMFIWCQFISLDQDILDRCQKQSAICCTYHGVLQLKGVLI